MKNSIDKKEKIRKNRLFSKNGELNQSKQFSNLKIMIKIVWFMVKIVIMLILNHINYMKDLMSILEILVVILALNTQHDLTKARPHAQIPDGLN